MKVTVTDANIFIDLIRIGLLDQFFTLEFEFHTTSSVLHELKSNQYDVLLPFASDGKLIVTTLDDNEMKDLNKLDASKKLSHQDLSVIYLSQKIKGSVLTGDNLIRKFCTKNHIEVYGILWLFDQLLENKVLETSIAITKLEILISINNR